MAKDTDIDRSEKQFTDGMLPVLSSNISLKSHIGDISLRCSSLNRKRQKEYCKISPIQVQKDARFFCPVQ